MIGSFAKKFLFKKSAKKPEPEQKTNLSVNLREKSQEISNALLNRLDLVKSELLTMKDKCGNLLETNYNLGLRHIEKGNLSDAIFRFRFIRKFWPHHHDSLYQLAYCLILKQKPLEAKKILEELMEKDPNHELGRELLDIINANVDSTPNLPSE